MGIRAGEARKGSVLTSKKLAVAAALTGLLAGCGGTAAARPSASAHRTAQAAPSTAQSDPQTCHRYQSVARILLSPDQVMRWAGDPSGVTLAEKNNMVDVLTVHHTVQPAALHVLSSTADTMDSPQLRNDAIATNNISSVLGMSSSSPIDGVADPGIASGGMEVISGIQTAEPCEQGPAGPSVPTASI